MGGAGGSVREAASARTQATGATAYELRDDVPARSRLLLVALSGASACVLLIACANLANLLLARAMERRREIAVRTAMGAGRERLVRHLMTESLVLAGIGGALGVCIAVAALPLLARLVPNNLPIAESPSVDARDAVRRRHADPGDRVELRPRAGIGAGERCDSTRCRKTRARVREQGATPLRAGGRRGRGLGRLLVSAGLLMRALWAVQATIPVPQRRARDDADGGADAQYEKVDTRKAVLHAGPLRSPRVPGVSRAAYVAALPWPFGGGIWPVSLTGAPRTRRRHAPPACGSSHPDYFPAMGIPLKLGRGWSETDTRGPAVRGRGQRVVRAALLAGGQSDRTAVPDRLQPRTIVGVVGNVRVRGLERPSEPQVYFPYQQMDDSTRRLTEGPGGQAS